MNNCRVLGLVAILLGIPAAQSRTPFEAIRPIWPLSWDSTVYKSIVDAKVGKPKPVIPASYAANQILPDTLDQAYLDAMTMQMSPIRVNQAGYRPQDEKLIYYVGTASGFDVVDSTGTNVYGNGTFLPTGQNAASSIGFIASNNAQNVNNGDTRYTANATGPSGTLMKATLPPGLPTDVRLRIKVGNNFSAPFVISDDIYSMVRDATLKFFGVNRSGNSESWFHPASHTLDGSVGGAAGSLAGGWYDCGDHLKEGQTQAYAFMALAVLAATNQNRDVDHYAYNQKEVDNPDGIPDMLREAKHGADFMLRAYRFSNGDIATMPIGVGDFGKDHGWWERPEYQDYTIHDRGGPTSRTPRAEVWSTTGGEVASGLAILSHLYASYDKAFADSALMVAKAIYDYGKAVKNTGTSSAYNGNNEYYDDLALAAICLLWVTEDTTYLYDIAENPALAGGQTKASFNDASNKYGAGMFNGGWFTHKEASFFKNVKNTSWANSYTYALYAFYKLILETESGAQLYGIDNTRRLRYIEDILYTMASNLGDVSAGSAAVTLPTGAAMWKQYKAGYDPIWFSMHTDQTWIYNRYQVGNIFDVLAYADVAKDMQNVNLPQTGIQDWKASDMYALGVNQMNYLLGLNPWDMSMIYGVGAKNYPHPHHRGSNPEGKNVPGAIYRYLPPVGGLFGGVTPGATNSMVSSQSSWSDYQVSEVCLDASAALLGPAVLLAKTEDLNRAPDISVEIKYVGFDSAIVVVKQTMRGTASIQYGTSETTLTSVASGDSAGVEHTIILKPLTNGTTYFFTATATNARSGNATIRYLVDSTQTPYSFTTLASPPAAADIQNVKVCNVSADSAEIMWYTPNGEYESKIYYDTVLTSYDKMAWQKSGDELGVPTQFHRMKIGGLKENTTYYYAVESNGAVKAVDDNGQPLKFTTPVAQHKFEVRTYKYEFGGLPFLNLNIYNMEEQAYDSLTIRLYFRAADGVETDIGIRMDICQAYDEAGFNNPCSAATITELTGLFRLTKPVKLPDTYDAATNTYQWYFPVPLGSTMIKSASRFRVDVAFDKRSPWPPYLDLMNQRPNKVPGETPGDWSWDSHTRGVHYPYIPGSNTDPVDFVGILTEDKDYGDAAMADVNPYVTVYRKDQFVWGYSPSYQEMTTKRADYEITASFDAPFNVSDGTYIQLDSASSTVHVRGTAKITEGGQVTDIWVNGIKLTDLTNVAVYDATSDLWNLDIPVRMAIGANKINVTIFAGPDVGCAECQENGGCAFVNRNYYVQFSRGNRTASSLTILQSDGNPIPSPATPGQLSFNITLRDADHNGDGSLEVLVINPRKGDTTKVVLHEQNGVFTTSSPISAVSKDPSQTGSSEIAFFGGDTILVVYVDPEDPEDIAGQRFYADVTYPVPTLAVFLDTDCDRKADHMRVSFSTAFAAGDKLDSTWVTIKDPSTGDADSFFVQTPALIADQTVLEFALDTSAGIPTTARPIGSAVFRIRTANATGVETSTIAVKDGIAPVLIGFTLLENPAPRSVQDTLKISFSEPVSMDAAAWPVEVSNASGSIDLTGLKVIGKATTADGGQSWLYIVEGNTNGALLTPGSSVSIRSSVPVSDLALNPLDDSICVDDVKIVEVPKPVPVTFAEIRDLDKNGKPNEIFLRFERKLRDRDMLDSFVVRFGLTDVRRSFLPADWTVGFETGSHEEISVDSLGDTTKVMVSDTMSTITIGISSGKSFPFGTTTGSDNGRGGVVPRLGPEGGFFDKEYVLNDKVGPVVVLARAGSLAEGLDSMLVTMSEPLDSTDGSGFFVDRKRGSGTPVALVPDNTISSRSDGLAWFFLYTSSVPGAARAGDSLRLQSLEPKYVDRQGNLPGENNPFTEVRGEVGSKVRFDVSMLHSATEVTQEDLLIGYGSHKPDPNEEFRISLVHPSNGTEILLGGGAGRLSSDGRTAVDTNEYRHIGPTFDITIYIPGAGQVRAGQQAWDIEANLDADLFDNIGQYVNKVSWAFDLNGDLTEYLDADGSLHLRLEWMVADSRAPRAATGRLVGNGAYVGRLVFSSSRVYLLDDEALGLEVQYMQGTVLDDTQEETQRFGVLRRR